MSTDPTSTPPSNSSSVRRKLVLFVMLCVAAVGGVIGYAVYSRRQAPLPGSSPTPIAPDNAQQLSQVRRQPHLLFRNTALGPSYGRVCVALLDAPDGVRYPTDLSCERVYGNREFGLCLQASRKALTTYKAVSFDRDFAALHTFNLAGGPSRTRVSHVGYLAAATVFVVGDTYAGSSFSTRTTIFDLKSSSVIGDLEEFTTLKEGLPFHPADINFWGVTFSNDGDRFYATLASGGVNYLVEGQISRREMRVLRPGVECPSLSPDGGRLAFKSRTSKYGGLWQLHVLDLKTQKEIVVNEHHSVDDQAEWLDGNQLLYSLPRNVPGSGTQDIWVARADGTGTPRLFMHDASSPCVLRP